MQLRRKQTVTIPSRRYMQRYQNWLEQAAVLLWHYPCFYDARLNSPFFFEDIDPDATYPPILVTTSPRDDRVHPGHARKFGKVGFFLLLPFPYLPGWIVLR